MPKLPPSSPFSHKVVSGTLATLAGALLFWKTGSDFEFVKFQPHLAEEVERRKRENIGTSIKHLDTRTLDYTPEAKARLAKGFEEKARRELEKTSKDASESKNAAE